MKRRRYLPGQTCSAPSCAKRPYKNGFCNAHNLLWTRRGRLHTTVRTEPNKCGEKFCPGRKSIDAHMHYVKNVDVYKAKAESWRVGNPERYAETKAAYHADEKNQIATRARAVEWRKKNPERKRAADAKFAAENPALVRSYKAARRARVLQATPSWLTPEHWEQIRAVYALAADLQKRTGVRFDVDHIVPLRGKTVCGLHVPWNLRAIPRDINNRRSRIWFDECPAFDACIRAIHQG